MDKKEHKILVYGIAGVVLVGGGYFVYRFYTNASSGSSESNSSVSSSAVSSGAASSGAASSGAVYPSSVLEPSSDMFGVDYPTSSSQATTPQLPAISTGNSSLVSSIINGESLTSLPTSVGAPDVVNLNLPEMHQSSGQLTSPIGLNTPNLANQNMPTTWEQIGNLL